MTSSSAGPLLSQIEEMVLEERYREAITDIGLLRRQKLNAYEQLQCGVLESRCYLGLGESSKALETAQDVVEEGGRLGGADITVIEALLEVADAARDLFAIDTLVEALDRAEHMRNELPTDDPSLLDSIRARILYHMSAGLYYRDDVHRGIECAQESLSIRQKLGDLEGVVSSIMRVGYLHMEIDPNQTLEYHKTGLELNKELGRKRHVLQALQCK